MSAPEPPPAAETVECADCGAIIPAAGAIECAGCQAVMCVDCAAAGDDGDGPYCEGCIEEDEDFDEDEDGDDVVDDADQDDEFEDEDE